MDHLMLDIETLGVSLDAPLISIGGVFFDPTTSNIGATFYQVIDLETSLASGAIEPSTLKWWMKQSDFARSVFNDPNSMGLKDTLIEFANFVACSNDPKAVHVWGNGASFDNAIMSSAYRKQSLKLPWDFRNDRDVRTIVDLAKTLKNIDVKAITQLEGFAHNALNDALHQAAYVSAAFQLLAN